MPESADIKDNVVMNITLGPEKRLLKVALVGLGRMGFHHLRIIESNRMAKIVGIADPKILADSMERPNGARLPLYKSVNELLDKTEPDVVHIITPPQTHFDLTKLALEAGAHVYVEKPFVAHRIDAGRLYDMASEKNLSLCAGHQLLFENPVNAARFLIPKIGKIINIESYFSFRQVRRSITAVEQLLDILPHPVYLLVHFLNLAKEFDVNSSFHLGGHEVSRAGEVRAIITHDDVYGGLTVTLNGRPVESYVRITGTNGCLHLDFVRGTVTKLLGPGTSVAAILNPYKQASQLMIATTKALAKLVTAKERAYQGLSALIDAFYGSILENKPSPTSRKSVLQTVGLCESLAILLNKEEEAFEERARKQIEKEQHRIDRVLTNRGSVLITGGTGFLGQRVVQYMTSRGWLTKVLARKLPPYSLRLPSVEYIVQDLSAGSFSIEGLKDISAVVHCAAETAGSLEAHEYNTVNATRNLLEACAKAGIKRFIHISSIAVLKSGKVIDEKTPLDWGNLSRGPYVWAKAEAEKDVRELQNKLGIIAKIIRPGPLVDYDSFQPPGRLGKEVGSTFIAVGSKNSRISVCDVKFAAAIIGSYVEQFDELPEALNLVEPDAPTRKQLTDLLKRGRPDLKVLWLPFWVVATISPPIKVFQKILFPRKKPVDIYTVFASEKYNTDKLRKVITLIQSSLGSQERLYLA